MLAAAEKLKGDPEIEFPLGGTYKSGWNLSKEFINNYLGMGGEFFTTEDAPFGARALPPDRLNFERHHWLVDADHPLITSGEIRLEESVVAPWFGQPGGSLQYRFLDVNGEPVPAWRLRETGIIQERAHAAR